jgi:hypothetical protein
LNWTICAPNQHEFHKWITAIVSALYGTTVVEEEWLTDSDDFEDYPDNDNDVVEAELVDTTQALDGSKQLLTPRLRLGDTDGVHRKANQHSEPSHARTWRRLVALDFDVLAQVATVGILVNAIMLMWREMDAVVNIVAMLVIVNLVVVGNVLLLVDVVNTRRHQANRVAHSSKAIQDIKPLQLSEHRRLSCKRRRSKQVNLSNNNITTNNNPRNAIAIHNPNNPSTPSTLRHTGDPSTDPSDSTALSLEKRIAGASFRMAPGSRHDDVVSPDWKPECHSWSHWGGVVPLDVRAGPDYKKRGTKQPSLSPLFEHTALEIFRSDKPLFDVAGRVQLPKVPPVRPDSGLPTHLLFNFQVAIGGGPAPYLNVMSYSTPTPEFARQVALIRAGDTSDQVSNAARLTDRWLRECTTDQALKHRLKLKAVVLNMNEVGFPTMFKQYNGKPVLVTKSAKVKVDKEADYFEVSVFELCES